MEMNLELKFLQETPEMAPLIASWYEKEWKIAREVTLSSLSGKMTTSFPFQIVCYSNGEPVGTAGLYDMVGLLRADPSFATYQPWLALVYTDPAFRGKGIGAWMCKEMDRLTLRAGFKRYYLYTFTAESLYRRLGWIEMDRVNYHGNDTVVMYRDLA